MPDSSPHSSDFDLIRMALWDNARGDWEKASKALPAVTRLEEQHEAAKVTITELELACDHHRMFWQQAEERERQLKEQLEALRLERNALLGQLRHADEMCARSFGACFDRRVLSSAIGPEVDSDYISYVKSNPANEPRCSCDPPRREGVTKWAHQPGCPLRPNPASERGDG